MKRIVMGAALAALCSLAACETPPRQTGPVETGGNLVACEGDGCFYPDGTPK